MKQIKVQYTILFKRVLLLFGVYNLMRLIFLLLNLSYFKLTTADCFIVFIAGMRFDLVAITILNILFIALHALPLKIFFSKGYQISLAILFCVFNSVAIIFNCVDFAFYKFILKRSGADLIDVILLGEDTGNNLAAMAKDFWHVPVLAFLIIGLLIYSYRSIKVPAFESLQSNSLQRNNKILPWLLLIPFSGLVIIAFRGGVQYKPLRIISAAEYNSPQNATLILNTTFTIIKTFNRKGVEPVSFYSDAKADEIFNPVMQYGKNKPFRKLNVVVIILEGIGKEYIGAFNNGKGYTPFIDSLIRQSLTFQYSYANSKKSIEGIPAVLASIPALMNEPYITSVYGGNKINSIASLLKNKGYQTAFFHGGNNGTMGFDNFTAAAGYDTYYGRNEYGVKDYDGNWGIFDEPFYKFFVAKMNEMKPPFHTALFTISSHHPYTIPDHLKNKFPKGTLPGHESVGYADYALKSFFSLASKQAWYDSTLFVITADHTSMSEGDYYKNKLGIYAVPIIYFMPHDGLKGWSLQVTQHASVLPSVMDYLNYNQQFVAFGNSVFDTTAHSFAANFMDDGYQLIDDYLIQFDGEKTTSCYAFKSDSLLTDNMLLTAKNIIPKEALLKAYIQQYNNRLINNKMSK